MLRDVLDRIGKNYLAAKDEPFKGHPLGRFIRKDGPDEVARVIADPKLTPKGGCGVSGQWAYVPWIGLFDPAITDGAQHGFYVVYLFSADMERVYLSMNQGTTEVQTELGSGEETFNELRSRAAIMRERAPDFQERLNIKQIDLASDRFYPRGYEAGHAFGREYQIASLPPENVLLDDVKEAVRLYRVLILRGGGSILSDEDAADAGLENASITEKRLYVAHRKLERNPKAAKAAKRVHGYVCQVLESYMARLLKAISKHIISYRSRKFPKANP
jgi:5-methylcytosine-specific restriction enzyme A